ncbi:MAG: hypothetical protein HZB33_04845 [Nitrospirae bacterium]|nr:hypothetical protein [Nitrospirota bacterium]
MNFKETIISSFFFHLILLLLMIAVSNYTRGFSGDIQKILSVDLTGEDAVKEPPAVMGESEGVPPMVSTPPSDEDARLPEQDAGSPPAESTIIPESITKAGPAAGPEKIEKAENPALQKDGSASAEAYYRFIMLHKKIFAQQAGVRVNRLLGEALNVNKRVFFGGNATVNLHFGPDGKLNEVLVDSESPSLKAFLEEIGWGGMPSPAQYSLGGLRVQIDFAVREGYMDFNVRTQ